MAANTPMLGIDLGGTKTEAALLDADGTELWRRRVPTPAGDYEGTVRTVAALVAAAAEAAGGAAFSIGIGTPGALAAGGLMKNCNSTCLNGRPLQRDLEAALGHAIALANDANCLALSEATDGAGAGFEVVFAAILGTGVGKKGAEVRWSVAGRMAVAWVTTLPAAAVVGALCFWVGHLIGDVAGSIVIFAILVAASGYMYWRAQQNKVDHNNVNADWDEAANSVIPAGDDPTSRPAPAQP